MRRGACQSRALAMYCIEYEDLPDSPCLETVCADDVRFVLPFPSFRVRLGAA